MTTSNERAINACVQLLQRMRNDAEDQHDSDTTQRLTQAIALIVGGNGKKQSDARTDANAVPTPTPAQNQKQLKQEATQLQRSIDATRDPFRKAKLRDELDYVQNRIVKLGGSL